MKKIFAIVLTLAMVMAMGTTAFAVTLNDTTTSTKTDVYVKTATEASDVAVISVDVTCDAMKWTYVKGGVGVWNPSDHSFGTTSDATWRQDGGNAIVITNHSNRDVQVEINIAKYDTGIALTVEDNNDNENNNLANGTVDGYDTAATMTAIVSITGTPDADVYDSYTDIADITVTITPTDTMTNSYT